MREKCLMSLENISRQSNTMKQKKKEEKVEQEGISVSRQTEKNQKKDGSRERHECLKTDNKEWKDRRVSRHKYEARKRRQKYGNGSNFLRFSHVKQNKQRKQ